METTCTNKVILAILAVNLGLLSLPASAGQDESQRYMIQQAITAKQQAKTTEADKQQADAIKLEECKN
jgi:hypothetical protein